MVALALGSFITLSSCDELLDPVETDFGQGPVLAQFQNTTDELNIIKDPTVPFIDYEIPITYFGGKNVALDRDVTVTIATSLDSEAVEGQEFELVSTQFTIPAGETTANASVRIKTENLVPFDFKDIVLEITNSSESVSDINTIALTLKALDANTLAGTYEVTDGQYWNSGSYIANYAGNTYNIEAIAPNLYRHVGLAYWVAGNNFYFTVDPDTLEITCLDKDLDNEFVLLNGSPMMTCENSYAFEMVPCAPQATLMPDGHHEIVLSVGYFRGVGATREFYQEMTRL